MATIKGKRFQITDGASTPTNLFPYTVSEAVYGLSNTISNAISTALSALSLSTYAGTSQIGSATQPVYYNGSALVATNLSTTYAPYNANGYLPLSAGSDYPLTGALIIRSGSDNKIILDNTDADTNYQGISFRQNGTQYGALGVFSVGSTNLQWTAGGIFNTIWHSGNSNLSTVPWSCSTLTASDHIYMANNKYLYRYDSGGVARSILDYESNGTMLFCWGNAAGGYSTSICGNTISLRYGTSHTIGMTMDTSGKVGIGTTTPAYKLDVAGSVRLGALTPADGLNLIPFAVANSGYSSTGWCASIGTDLGGVLLGYRKAISAAIIGGSTNANIVLAPDGGNVGVGVLSPSQKLHVAGTILSTGDQVVSSDATLKENLTPVTYSVSDIAKARAVEFDWKDGRGHSMGSIAQDWLGIAPALVHGEEGNMSLAYGQLALVNTILLARQSESHEERIARLEKENAELKKEVKRLRMN